MQSDFRKKFLALLIVSALCAFCATTVFAADITGKIRGTVTDPTGAVVANADITATHVGTGSTYKAASGSSGDYEFAHLPIGGYNVTVVAQGFQKYSAKGINLSIDQVYVLSVGLKVGAATETVEVSASAVQVDTTNIQLGAVIDNKQIVDLPLIGRNFTQLQLLLPGVQASSDRMGTFSANGQQTQQSNFLVNGTDTNDFALNTPLYIPSLDSIQQFNFATNSINPEYGRNSGGIVSAAIKSGSNAFHGTGFEFYRDTFLNTRNFFQRPSATSDGVPVFHQNIFGGGVGGPIWKDKAFFFVNFQGIRARQPQGSFNPTVFSPAQRAGDFSTDLATLGVSTGVIPGTVGAVLGGINANCVGGNTWGQCFTATGGLIPGGAASFPAVSTNLLAFVPLPNGGDAFTWNATTKVPFTKQLIGRVDFNLSQKDLLWGSLTIQTAPTTNDSPFSGSNLPGFGSTNQSHVKQFTTSWTHTFNPTTLNELRVGYTRLNFKANFPQAPALPSSVGFAINPQFPAFAGLPTIPLTGFFTLGFTNNGPQPRIDENRQAADNFTKIMGRHSLKFGVDVRRFNVNSLFLASNSGTITFGGSGQFSTGNAGVDFLLGVPDSYSQSTGSQLSVYAWETYIYGQDVWKARNNLTFTLGFGWQVDTQFHNRQYNGQGVACFIPGQQSTVFPNNFSGGGTLGPPVGLNYPGDPGCNDSQGAQTQWKNLGPRFGFAWSPNLGRISAGSSGKFVIRGGVGVYYNRSDEEQALQNLGTVPYGLTSGGAVDYGFAGPSFANPYRDIDTGAVGANKFPSAGATAGQLLDFTPFLPVFFLHQISKDMKVPYSVNYNLTVERELPANIVMKLSYVGSQARRLATTEELNPITQTGHDLCLLDPVCIADRNFQPLDFPTHTLFNNGDIFPGVGTITSKGNARYNALQISATKGQSHGLLFQASYTYSHSLDDASSFENAGFGGFGGTPVRGYNQFFRNLNYGNSAFDARHRFVFSPVYEIPNWKHIRGLEKLPDVIGRGWKISGIMTFASGFPFDISYAGGTSRSLWCSAVVGYYVCPDQPNQTGPLVLGDPRAPGTFVNAANPGNGCTIGRNCWFVNRGPGLGTIVNSAVGTFGNIGRNKFHGPGINNLDMAVEKDIYFWPGNERRYIELRFEMYNALNHTQFALPSGNFLSSAFGQSRAAAAARAIQLGAKIYF